jgi:hypothetical protein
MMIESQKEKRNSLTKNDTFPRLDMMVHTCNPTVRGLRQEAYKFEVSLGYIMRSCPQKYNNNTIPAWEPSHPRYASSKLGYQGHKGLVWKLFIIGSVPKSTPSTHRTKN